MSNTKISDKKIKRLESIKKAHSQKNSFTTRMEDYLEVISELVELKGYASPTDISNYMDVSPPSVTKMLRRLDADGYLKYTKYQGLKLTPKGEHIASDIRQKHSALLCGALILINGIANFVIALGNLFPGPGMMPLMMGMPFGGGMMFPMMGFSSSVFWASLSGIIVGPIVLASAILLYTHTPRQMLWGAIIVAGAIVGLLSGGGFFVGSVLGIVGGLIAITVKIR